jgi:hypothetical protein
VTASAWTAASSNIIVTTIDFVDVINLLEPVDRYEGRNDPPLHIIHGRDRLDWA